MENIIINPQITEMVKDYRNVQDAYTKAEKLVFANKYGVDSNKAKEIAQAIILKANDIRKKRTSYDDGDWYIWNLAFDGPYTRKKIEEALEGEHINFIQFAIEKTVKPSWRGDKRNVIFRQILQERKNAADPLLAAIKKQLFNQTVDFKKQYIDSILSHELKRFDYYAQYKDLKIIEVRDPKVYYKFVKVIDPKYTGPQPEKFDQKWWRSFNTIAILSQGFNRDFFIDRVTKESETQYKENIESVAEKLFKLRANDKLLKVHFITSDPKLFEMYISDGTESFHCRSIFCAEYSHLVQAHWRFIITKRNK